MQILRDLGYPPEELFFGFETPVGRRHNMAFIQLKRGGSTFNWALEEVLDHTYESATQLWSDFIEDVNQAPDQERELLWEASKLRKAFTGYLDLASRLRNRGFDVPKFGELAELIAEVP